MKENKEVKEKLMNLESEVAKLKLGPNVQNKTSQERVFSKSCKVCNTTFLKNSDLEMHVMEAHQAEKKFICDVCDKSFVLEWRYKKHVLMHTDMNVKSCHFFKNSIKCPYEHVQTCR